MKLIVGLGNPGKKYKLNRHNAGFLVLDKLRNEISRSGHNVSNWNRSKNAKAMYCKTIVSDEAIEFIKPQTRMNRSGHSVGYAKNKHGVDPGDIYIIYDDLDIKLGDYKIVRGKGPRDHNGVNDIYENIGTRDFWHIRVGVDNRDRDNKIPGKKYVLMDFTADELGVLKGVSEKVIENLLRLIDLKE